MQKRIALGWGVLALGGCGHLDATSNLPALAADAFGCHSEQISVERLDFSHAPATGCGRRAPQTPGIAR